MQITKIQLEDKLKDIRKDLDNLSPQLSEKDKGLNRLAKEADNVLRDGLKYRKYGKIIRRDYYEEDFFSQILSDKSSKDKNYVEILRDTLKRDYKYTEPPKQFVIVRAKYLKVLAERTKLILRRLDLSCNLDIVNEILLNFDLLPSIRKVGRDYSLYLSNKKIFSYDNNDTFSFLDCKNKDSPLVLRSYKGYKDFNNLDNEKDFFDNITSNIGFGPFEFFVKNASGNKIFPYIPIMLVNQQHDIAKKIFEYVKSGVEILPKKINIDDILNKRENYESKNFIELKPRHWGQEYLTQLSPKEIIQGEILGSGGSYKAYNFDGDKTVVEFDMDKRATYLFKTSYFRILKNFARSDLLKTTPEGFDGRVWHKEQDHSDWKKQIQDFLK